MSQVKRRARAGEAFGAAPLGLERIMFSRNRYVVPTKHVNPLYIKLLEQIHRFGWITQAIPSNPDLL